MEAIRFFYITKKTKKLLILLSYFNDDNEELYKALKNENINYKKIETDLFIKLKLRININDIKEFKKILNIIKSQNIKELLKLNISKYEILETL